jgi:hypothetical protein
MHAVSLLDAPEDKVANIKGSFQRCDHGSNGGIGCDELIS